MAVFGLSCANFEPIWTPSSGVLIYSVILYKSRYEIWRWLLIKRLYNALYWSFNSTKEVAFSLLDIIIS